MRFLTIASLILTLAVSMASTVSAQIFTEYADETEWRAMSAGFNLVEHGYSELPAGSLLFDQYIDQGVLYLDQDEYTYFDDGPYAYWDDDFAAYSNPLSDPASINGSFTLSFLHPVYTIGVGFGANLTIECYVEGELIYTSSNFIQDPWNEPGFGGLVSDTPFDAVILRRDNPNAQYLDDVCFNGPGTAPIDESTWGNIKSLYK